MMVVSMAETTVAMSAVYSAVTMAAWLVAVSVVSWADRSVYC